MQVCTGVCICTCVHYSCVLVFIGMCVCVHLCVYMFRSAGGECWGRRDSVDLWKGPSLLHLEGSRFES